MIFSNLAKVIKGSTKHPVLEYGDCDPEIHGNRYEHCQSLLRKIYRTTKDHKTTFTLTPPIEYQEKQGWPEPPFVNVNIEGSQSTTRDNWLGYIPITYSDIDYLTIVNINGPVDVFGEIKKEKGGEGLYYICLNVSDIYRVYSGYVQHDKTQLDFLKKVAKGTDDYDISVDAVKQQGDGKYSFLYNGKVVATATPAKIDAWLSGAEIASSRIKISHLRLYDDVKPFSEIIISKKIVL